MNDTAATTPEKERSPILMDCIVIGGCANGVLLREIRADAELIELRRPQHIKPLESPSQAFPEVHHEKDRYQVHAIHIVDFSKNGAVTLLGVATVEGRTLKWALEELIVGFVENTTMKMVQEGLIIRN